MRFTRQAAVAAAAGCMLVSAAVAEGVPMLSGSDAVQPKVAGNAVPVTLMRGLEKVPVAQGSDRMDGGTAANPFYGYDGDGPMVPAPGDLPTPHAIWSRRPRPSRTRTRTWCCMDRTAPTHAYNYGTHFVFQGHEGGSPGFLTPDQPRRRRGAPRHADGDARTRTATRCPTTTARPGIRSHSRLLLTTEDNSGPASTRPRATTRPGWPTRRRVRPRRLRGRPDRPGRATSGWSRTPAARPAPPTRMPSSRTASSTGSPRATRTTSAGGKLEALQVISLRSGNPIVFHDGQADHDIASPDRRDLHTYGKQFQTRWVTVHDNATDGIGIVRCERRWPRRRGRPRSSDPRTACSGRLRIPPVRVHRDR